jgi:hypothetical protein
MNSKKTKLIKFDNYVDDALISLISIAIRLIFCD